MSAEEDQVPAEEEEAAEEAAADEPKPKKKKKKAAKKADKSEFLGDIKKGEAKKKLKKKKKSGKKKKKKAKAADADDEKVDPNKKKFAKTDAGRKQAKKAFKQFQQTAVYNDQVEFFMNAMWDPLNLGDKKTGLKLCVEMYDSIDFFLEAALQAGGGKQNACDLDEFQTSRYFEAQEKGEKEICGKAMTRSERLAAFKHIDLDGNKRYSLLEVLIWNFEVDIVDLMNAPQGTNEQLKIAEKALKNAIQIIADIEAQKSEYREIIAKAKDPNDKTSGVKGAKASAELAAIESKDNLPLNKLLITAEAALRKAKKSKDLFAMGKQWMLGWELKQAKAYKPSGGIKKGRFSVAATKAKKKRKKNKKKKPAA